MKYRQNMCAVMTFTVDSKDGKHTNEISGQPKFQLPRIKSAVEEAVVL